MYQHSGFHVISELVKLMEAQAPARAHYIFESTILCSLRMTSPAKKYIHLILCDSNKALKMNMSMSVSTFKILLPEK